VIPFPPAIQAPVQTPGPETPLPFTSLKAQYKWSFRGAKDSGSGALALRLEPAGGKLVLEVFSYGDRLALVDGDSAGGYQLVLPKEKVNRTVPTLAELPLPFLPQAGSVEALARALANGEGDGLSVEKRDAQGPVKLRYAGRDSDGDPVEVVLTRKRWEPAK
jgi:hypothetical protein